MEFNALVRVYTKTEDGSTRIVSFVFPVDGACPVAKLVDSVVERSREYCREDGLSLFEVKIEIVEEGQGIPDNQLPLPFPKC